MIDGQPTEANSDIYGSVINLNEIVAHLDNALPVYLAEALCSPPLWHSLQDADANQIVTALKDAADRYWGIDPRQSITFADAIIAIGNARSNVGWCALGTMAKGDALKFIGSQHEAWSLLESAGHLYQSIQ